MEKGLDFLCRKNTRVCRKTDMTFGEFICYFVVGYDELCLMGDANGEHKILGEAGKRKH